MQKAINKTNDKNYVRRLAAMLMLHQGVIDVSRTLLLCPFLGRPLC